MCSVPSVVDARVIRADLRLSAAQEVREIDTARTSHPGRIARGMSRLPSHRTRQRGGCLETAFPGNARLRNTLCHRLSAGLDPQHTIAATAQAGGLVLPMGRTLWGGRNARVPGGRAMTRPGNPFPAAHPREPPETASSAIRGSALKTSHACIARYFASERQVSARKNSLLLVQKLWRTKLLCGKC